MQQAHDTKDDDTETAEDLAAASASATPPVSERGEAPRALGLARWVQYVFVIGAAFLFWFLDKVATLSLQLFTEPSAELVTGGSLLAAAVVAWSLYRREPARRLITEIVAELAKVTWPSRDETYVASVVVIITSIIAAAVIGSFDFVWSAITDLLYKYKV